MTLAKSILTSFCKEEGDGNVCEYAWQILWCGKGRNSESVEKEGLARPVSSREARVTSLREGGGRGASFPVSRGSSASLLPQLHDPPLGFTSLTLCSCEVAHFHHKDTSLFTIH